MAVVAAAAHCLSVSIKQHTIPCLPNRKKHTLTLNRFHVAATRPKRFNVLLLLLRQLLLQTDVLAGVYLFDLLFRTLTAKINVQVTGQASVYSSCS